MAEVTVQSINERLKPARKVFRSIFGELAALVLEMIAYSAVLKERVVAIFKDEVGDTIERFGARLTDVEDYLKEGGSLDLELQDIRQQLKTLRKIDAAEAFAASGVPQEATTITEPDVAAVATPVEEEDEDVGLMASDPEPTLEPTAAATESTTPEPTAKVSAATPAAEEPESKTIVATGGKDLNTLLGMVQSSKDEWEAKKAAVRDSFEEALNEESLLIIGKFYDPDARGGRGWSQSHYWWLIYRLANLDEPTIQNEAGAIRYAREHHSEDDPWVKDCEVKPSVYKIIKAIAKADGRYVKPGVIFQGEKINPFLLIANDVEAGKETYESGYKKVRAAGWTGIDQDVEAEELYGSEDKIEAMREYRGGGSVSHASARHRADSGDKPDNTVGSLARVTNGKPVKKGGRRS